MTSFVDEVFSFYGRIITENLVIEFCSFELGNVDFTAIFASAAQQISTSATNFIKYFPYHRL